MGWAEQAQAYLLAYPDFIVSFALCRAMRVTVTIQTYRSSASPVDTPSIHVLPCATWSAVMPRSGCQPEGGRWCGNITGPRVIDMLSRYCFGRAGSAHPVSSILIPPV